MKTITTRKFNTDLGIILLSIEMFSNSEVVENDNLSYETNDYKISIQEFKIEKEWIHNQMHIDSSIVWRIFTETKSDINENLLIKCKLINPSEEVIWDNESGERLDAIKIENETYQLSIGTEDWELLERRAERSDWMPNRFKDSITKKMTTFTEQINFGFETKIPSLLKGEKVYIHFLVAAKNKTEPNDIATNFAVDQHKDFLDLKEPFLG